jgi:hypothetical protein
MPGSSSFSSSSSSSKRPEKSEDEDENDDEEDCQNLIFRRALKPKREISDGRLAWAGCADEKSWFKD